MKRIIRDPSDGSTREVNAPAPMKKSNTRTTQHDRVENIKCWCRGCWGKFSVQFDWSEMQGWTMDDLRRACEYRHAKQCNKADVRMI